jgi:hypothetical protein
MSNALAEAIAGLYSPDPSQRAIAGKQIYQAGRALADSATQAWQRQPEFLTLVGPEILVTVGLAVEPTTFAKIRSANGNPPLAKVPPDQDAEEFELHLPEQISLDILTTREPGGAGAIARYLSKFGEGIQQVEYRCSDVDRASAILKEEFALAPVYPQTRPGADGTRINFFLIPTPSAGKVLIELYEPAKGPAT